jgi:hypothetical protein
VTWGKVTHELLKRARGIASGASEEKTAKTAGNMDARFRVDAS